MGLSQTRQNLETSVKKTQKKTIYITQGRELLYLQYEHGKKIHRGKFVYRPVESGTSDKAVI